MHHEHEQNEQDHAGPPFEVDVPFCQVCIVSEQGLLLSVAFDSGG
jgi:hypothetical protein